MTARYETVLFDWDGCLLASLDAWLVAFTEAARSVGLEPDSDQVTAQFGAWDLTQLGIPAASQPEFMSALDRSARQSLGAAALYEGSADLLHALRAAGCAVALVTSSPERAVTPALAKLELTDAFDAVVTADDVRAYKPDAEPVRLALRRLRRPTTGAVMIGDSGKDVGAAVAAGVDSVLIHGPAHRHFHDVAEIRRLQPTYEVESVTALAGLLLPAAPA